MFSTLGVYMLILTNVQTTMLISGIFFPLDYTPFESSDPFSFEHSKPRRVPGTHYLWHTFQKPHAKARMRSGPLSPGRIVRGLRGERKKQKMSFQREECMVYAVISPLCPDTELIVATQQTDVNERKWKL